MEMASFERQGKIRKEGKRCVSYGCGNTSYNGFYVHKLPDKMPTCQLERFRALQKSWVDFIGRKRKFDMKDAQTYSKIHICSGCFQHENYETTHVEMFRRRLRIKPQALRDVAEKPVSTFVVQATDTSSLSQHGFLSHSISSRTPISTSSLIHHVVFILYIFILSLLCCMMLYICLFYIVCFYVCTVHGLR